MGGSKGGKHSRGKEKSKLIKNKVEGQGDSKVKSPDQQTKASSCYTVNEMEEFLLIKLEDLYAKAKGWLLTSGYGMADIERAILNNGYIHGRKDPLNNVLANTVAFLKRRVEPKGKPFMDMKELYKAMLEALIDSTLHNQPDLQRSEAMWHLLLRNWGTVPSTSTPSGVLSEDVDTDSIKDGSSGSTSHSSSESTSTRDLTSTVERTQSDVQNAGWTSIEGSKLVDSDILTYIDQICVKRWLESSPNDLKTAFIVDLVKSVRDLDEKVKVQKQWAQQKVVDSAKKLSKDLNELYMLKLEKVETQRLKDEKLCAENSCLVMLKETEQSLRNVNCEASTISQSINTLQASNANIRADTEALRLSTSEYGNKLNRVLHREMKCMKKQATIENQICNLRANCDEEKQKVLQLQLDVVQTEKEAKEAEEEWKEEIKEKERTLALLAEETRKAELFQTNLKEELLDIRQSIAIERNRKNDVVKRLERDLSCLQMFHQMSNVSLEGDTFLFNGIEVTSLEQSAPHEPLKHWICMVCSTNEVSIVFLPCTHQVLCAPCYEGRCSSSTSRQHCPYCGSMIQESIKAYAPT